MDEQTIGYKKYLEDTLVEKIGKPILRPIALLQLIFVLCIVVSPFMLFWFDWLLVLKIFGTGVLGVITTYYAYKIVRSIVSDIIDEKIKSNKPNILIKSKFQQKLEHLSELREQEIKA